MWVNLCYALADLMLPPFQVDVSWNKQVACNCQEKILSSSFKTLVDVRDSILKYHIMVGYCSYFTLWGLGICATYYIKEVHVSVLYITLILIYVMEEVWEYWMEIDIMILYSNTT